MILSLCTIFVTTLLIMLLCTTTAMTLSALSPSEKYMIYITLLISPSPFYCDGLDVVNKKLCAPPQLKANFSSNPVCCPVFTLTEPH